MTDAEFEAQNARVTALREKWLEPLGLADWTVDLHFLRGGIRQTDVELAGGFYCIMQTNVLWQYKRGRIEVNSPQLDEYDDDDLERMFVHECLHFVVHEMRMWASANEPIMHEERVVTHLTNMIFWLRRAWTPAAAEADSSEVSS